MWWQIVLWFFLGITAVVMLLAFLPVGIRVRYGQGELKVWYTLGPVRLLRYPEDAKTHENRKNAKINIRTVLDEPIKANREYDNVLGDFLAELKTTLGLLWYLRPRLRINRLVLKLHLAGDNPAALALQYGSAWAAIGAFFPLLEEGLILNKRDLDVDCDFGGDKTTLDAKLDITIGLGRLLLSVVRYSMNTLEKAENKHLERR